MADDLDVLLDKVDDRALRAELRTAVDKVRAKRNFGLVFESHLPERVALPDHPVRRGTTVVRRADKRGGPLKVETVRRGQATVIDNEGDHETIPVGDLVVVAEFGEPVYPGLQRLGSIDRGGDKPAHVVINAENHHALEMLQFTHAGKVDCIYIDPPYNTGAKDWKYDNNYVDGEDAYRHSKWLAFMERRLLLAKKLLNPDNSVLIVTIDEKEVHRLGLLLNQTFPSARIQCVSVAINPAAIARASEFRRADEHYFFVMLGSSGPLAVPLGGDWVTSRGRTHRGEIRWDLLRRSAEASARRDRPGMFFPIFVKVDGSGIHSVGDAIELGVDRHEVAAPDGTIAAWPIRKNGSEGRWRLGPGSTRECVDRGFIKIGTPKGESTPVYYLTAGEQKKVADGIYQVVGRSADGSIVTDLLDSPDRRVVPSTQWHVSSHDSTQYGSRLLQQFLPGRRFPFPKSLYAVEDALRFFLTDAPDAIVLDFFAGSGTTAHAIMRLNGQDGGRRQSIVVTNNEVSADEAKSLTEEGLRDGDAEWEALGIYEYITRPRITAAVTGRTPDGDPVKGDYKFTDEFPMADGFDENVEFFKLTYLDPVDVELDRAFEAVAPLLWMRAGGQGPVVESNLDVGGEPLPFAVVDQYGVLFNPDRWRDFVDALPSTAETVFVVTDSAAVFAGVAESLPSDLSVVRLYENYLTTFAINQATPS